MSMYLPPPGGSRPTQTIETLPAAHPAPARYQSASEGQAIDYRRVWQVVRRSWLVIGGIIGAALAVGWFYTARLPRIYQATATLRIDADESHTPLPNLATPAAAAYSADPVSTEMEMLRSRSLAERVVGPLGLRVVLIEGAGGRRTRVVETATVSDSAPLGAYVFVRQADGSFKVSAPGGGSFGRAWAGQEVMLPGAMVRLAPVAGAVQRFTLAVVDRESAAIAVQGGLTIVRPNREANVIAVKYRGTDPRLAEDIANALADEFIGARVRTRKTGARSTVDFLRTQLDTITRQLRRAEDSLKAFREAEHVVSLQAEGSAQIENLARLQAERTSLDAERTALDRLVSGVQDVSAVPGAPSPWRKLLAFPSLLKLAPAATLLSNISELEKERASLLQRRRPADPDVVQVQQGIADQEEQIKAMVLTYVSGLREQVAALDGTLATFGKQLEKIPAKEVRFARLERDTKILGDLATMLQTRLKETEITEAVEDPSALVVDLALRPAVPVLPRVGFNLFAAGFLGLLLAGAFVFAREWLDQTVHTREDIQNLTGVAVLGLIPHIREVSRNARREKSERRKAVPGAVSPRSKSLVVGRDPKSMVSEAYRALRTNLAFAQPERPPKTVVFTSPAPGDGKTTCIANLAATLAQQGQRVLVVDCDMRRGMINRVFAVDREPGLSNLLARQVALEKVVRAVTLQGGGAVDVICTGPLPPNPAELLASDHFRRILEELEPSYETILLDSPPINLFTDAAVLGSQCDGVVVVVRAAKSDRDELSFSMDQLRNVRVQVLGAVLNDFDFKRDAPYSGSYYYYYSPDYSYDGTNGRR